MKSLLLILSLSLILFSCGEKKSSSTVKLKLSKIMGTGTYMAGGIILSGHTLDDSEGFNLGITDPNQDIVLSLKKGDWEFLAVGWTGGSGFFSGNNQCAYVGPIKIDGDSMNVVFNLNYTTCGDVPNHGQVLAAPAFMTSSSNPNQFLPLQIISCNILDVTNKQCLNSSLNPTTPDGLTRSIQILMRGQGKGGIGGSALPSIGSSCIQLSSSAISSAVNVHLPVGNVNDKIIPFNVLAYTTSDCTGSPIDYAFRDKSMVDGINLSSQKAIVNSESGPKTVLYLEHNPQTISNNIGYNPFGYGKDGDITNGYAKTVSDFGRIIEMSDSSAPVKTKITMAAGDGTSININDEVMIYVNNDSDGTKCGEDWVSGMLMHGLVIAKDTTNNILTIDKDLKQYTLRFPNGTTSPAVFTYPLATNLQVSIYGSGCSMQVVKVSNYKNVSLPVSTTLSTIPFSTTTHVGGFLPFKVSDTFSVGANSGQAIITAAGSGMMTGYTQYKRASPNDCYSSGKACVYFGGAATSSYGGGLIFASINKLYFTGTGTNTLKFDVSGSGGSASGGQANIVAGTIGMAAGVTPYINMDASANAGYPAGVLYFDYCNNMTGSNISSVVSPTLNGAASTGFFSLNQKCGF